MSASPSFNRERLRMVEEIARNTGLRPGPILDAFLGVARHEFVPPSERHLAYEDRPLPLGGGQTISQPSMLALMLDALGSSREDKVLEIGAGSGYAAALLSRLCEQVFAVELLPELAARARETLQRLGHRNVSVSTGDGIVGLPEAAPFDAILVSAAAASVPVALEDQLAVGGRLVIPVGGGDVQILRVGQRDAAAITWTEGTRCRFVPLVGS